MYLTLSVVIILNIYDCLLIYSINIIIYSDWKIQNKYQEEFMKEYNLILNMGENIKSQYPKMILITRFKYSLPQNSWIMIDNISTRNQAAKYILVDTNAILPLVEPM